MTLGAERRPPATTLQKEYNMSVVSLAIQSV